MRAVIVGLAMVVSGAAFACTSQDIKITQFNAFPQSVFTRIVGEIENNCSVATGAQLQAVFRLKSGEIVDVYTFWPKSTNNLFPKERYAFATSHDMNNRKYDLLDIVVVSVNQWKN